MLILKPNFPNLIEKPLSHMNKLGIRNLHTQVHWW